MYRSMSERNTTIGRTPYHHNNRKNKSQNQRNGAMCIYPILHLQMSPLLYNKVSYSKKW